MCGAARPPADAGERQRKATLVSWRPPAPGAGTSATSTSATTASGRPVVSAEQASAERAAAADQGTTTEGKVSTAPFALDQTEPGEAPRPSSHSDTFAEGANAAPASGSALARVGTGASGSESSGAGSPKARLFLDEEDQSEWPRPKASSASRAPWIVAVIGVGIAAGALALTWDSLAPKLGLAPDDRAFDAAFREGDQALRGDEPDQYKRALAAYADVLAKDAKHPRALASAATAEASWAQWLAFEASDLHARSESDPLLKGDAESRAASSASHARQAKAYGERLHAVAPTNAAGLVALADAERLLGSLDKAESHLTRARRLEASPSSDTYRAVALLAAAKESGDVSVARADAERAVEADSTSVRARLLLARVFIARKDVAAAREQLAAITVLARSHPGAAWLTDALDRGLPPAPPVVEVTDAGPADGAGPDGGVSTAAPDAAAVDPAAIAPAKQGVAGSAAPPAAASPAQGGKRDYNALIRSADGALDRGKLGEARALYLAAFDLKPTGAEALTGLGYVALEEGDPREAIRRFEPAALSGYADAFIGLGDAYRKIGRTDDAIGAYERYLERLPDGNNASIARRQIAALGGRRTKNEPTAPDAPPSANEPAPGDPNAGPGVPNANDNPYAETPPAPPPAPAPPDESPPPAEPPPAEPPADEPPPTL
jgi:tetratricopeptide (TPR) repeat protein